MSKIKYFSLLIFCLLSFSSFGQRENVSQYNTWLMYSGTHKLSSKFDWYTEYQFRRSGFIVKPFQWQLRTALDYKITNSVSLSPAYVFTYTVPYGKQTPTAYEFSEHRPYEQITLKSNHNRVEIFQRYRLEQRFIEIKQRNTDGEYVFDKWEFRNRVRYRLLVNIPLNHKTMADKTIFAQFWNELFIGFGKHVKKNIFDQNRLAGGFGYKFNKNATVLAYYLYHAISKSDGVKFENNHTALVSFVYNLDFSKKSE